MPPKKKSGRRPVAPRMRFATLRNCELKIGSTAIAAKPLGDRRHGWEGRKTRTVPVPVWCKCLIDAWLRGSREKEAKVFRRVSKERRSTG
jgi:hypothetical protein